MDSIPRPCASQRSVGMLALLLINFQELANSNCLCGRTRLEERLARCLQPAWQKPMPDRDRHTNAMESNWHVQCESCRATLLLGLSELAMQWVGSVVPTNHNVFEHGERQRRMTIQALGWLADEHLQVSNAFCRPSWREWHPIARV